MSDLLWSLVAALGGVYLIVDYFIQGPVRRLLNRW